MEWSTLASCRSADAFWVKGQLNTSMKLKVCWRIQRQMHFKDNFMFILWSNVLPQLPESQPALKQRRLRGCSVLLQRSFSCSWYSHTIWCSRSCRQAPLPNSVTFKCDSRRPWPLQSPANETEVTRGLHRQVFDFIIIKNWICSCLECRDDNRNSSHDCSKMKLDRPGNNTRMLLWSCLTSLRFTKKKKKKNRLSREICRQHFSSMNHNSGWQMNNTLANVKIAFFIKSRFASQSKRGEKGHTFLLLLIWPITEAS